jgi:hypothetical protein
MGYFKRYGILSFMSFLRNLSPEEITAWATVALVVAALVLAVLAVFQDQIKNKWYGPKLQIEISCKPPCIAKIPHKKGEMIAYADHYRVWVRNGGQTY